MRSIGLGFVLLAVWVAGCAGPPGPPEPPRFHELPLLSAEGINGPGTYRVSTAFDLVVTIPPDGQVLLDGFVAAEHVAGDPNAGVRFALIDAPSGLRWVVHGPSGRTISRPSNQELRASGSRETSARMQAMLTSIQNVAPPAQTDYVFWDLVPTALPDGWEPPPHRAAAEIPAAIQACRDADGHFPALLEDISQFHRTVIWRPLATFVAHGGDKQGWVRVWTTMARLNLHEPEATFEDVYGWLHPDGCRMRPGRIFR